MQLLFEQTEHGRPQHKSWKHIDLSQKKFLLRIYTKIGEMWNLGIRQEVTTLKAGKKSLQLHVLVSLRS